MKRIIENKLWSYRAGVWSIYPIKEEDLVAVGSQNDDPIIYNINSGRLVEKFYSKTDIEMRPISTAVVVMNKGKKLIHGNVEGKLLYWDLENYNLEKEIAHPNTAFQTLSISPDNKKLSAFYVDMGFPMRFHNIKVIDVESGETIQEIKYKGLTDLYKWTAISDTHVFISNKNVIEMRSIETGELVREFKGHKGDILYMKYESNKPNQLFSGAGDGSIRIWNIKNGKCEKILSEDVKRFRRIDISPSGNEMAAISDNIIWIWDLKRYNQTMIQEIANIRGTSEIKYLNNDKIALGLDKGPFSGEIGFIKLQE